MILKDQLNKRLLVIYENTNVKYRKLLIDKVSLKQEIPSKAPFTHPPKDFVNFEIVYVTIINIFSRVKDDNVIDAKYCLLGVGLLFGGWVGAEA